jgi:Flp pilus assembly protein TadG
MQRLISRLRRRLVREDGASAALVAVLLVPVLGFAAIAVDVGALYAERARLQVAADAAAIAVAQDCARGDCGDMLATATSLLLANDPEGRAGQPVLGNDPISVTVTGSTPKEHWFAPVIGHESTGVSASATVGWGAPVGGTAVLPLTFSWCAFKQQTGGGLPSGSTPRVVDFTKSDSTVGCTGPSNLQVPGGFGWLVPDNSSTCGATSEMDGTVTSEPGNNPPKPCTQAYFASLLRTSVLLPIFDEYGASGANAWYRVYGYAAFTITGYDFKSKGKSTPTPTCGGPGNSGQCIAGYFTRFVELSDAWHYSPDAPTLGSSVLRLIR